MVSIRRLCRCLLSLLLCLLAGSVSPTAAQTTDTICFPEAAPVIRDCVAGRFAAFWRAHGGLAVFGYPITSARIERNADTGALHLTQYFERQRMELHPDQPPPYDVLLGRLGAEWLARQGPGFHRGALATPDQPGYASATGYAIGFQPTPVNPEGGWYRDYHAAHGLEFDGQPGTSPPESLALLGHPLTAPILRMSTETSYQVFERAILRYQGPRYAHDPAWRIVGDRLGVWYVKFVLQADGENRLAYP